MTIHDRIMAGLNESIMANLDLYIAGLEKASLRRRPPAEKVIYFEDKPGAPPLKHALPEKLPEKLPINIYALSDQEAMEMAHEIVKTKGASEVNQLKILILKKAEAAKKAAVFEQTEAAKKAACGDGGQAECPSYKALLCPKKSFSAAARRQGENCPKSSDSL